MDLVYYKKGFQFFGKPLKYKEEEGRGNAVSFLRVHEKTAILGKEECREGIQPPMIKEE